MAGRKSHESVRIFQNPYLEMLTHVHPAVPLLVWVPIICAFLWRSIFVHELSALSVLSLGAFGFVMWTLFEYLLHRFIFHFDAKSEQGKRLVYLFHGLHHDDPQDPTRLVMPPAGGLFIGALIFGFSRIFLGPVLIDPFFAFFLIGYLCYDYTHFAVHHFNPTTRFGRYLKQTHMVHHYADPNSRWGVSSPLWDYVFGTAENTAAEGKRVRHGS